MVDGVNVYIFFFSSRRRHTRCSRDWSSDVCSSDLIGMTNLTEAKLAREAEICYATIAMITDYDCWHPDHESVTAAQIIATLNQNAENAQKVLRAAVRELPSVRSCKCDAALQHALVTDMKLVPTATKKRLAAIIGKYSS